MDNILYLDDYINLYNKKSNKLIIIKPYKNTLRNGFVIDKEKFVKKLNSTLEKNNLKNVFIKEDIFIIINNLYSRQEKVFIKEVMEELEYKNINFIQEINYLKQDKKNVYINCNFKYFYLIYTNNLGNVEINLYKNDNINKCIIKNIIKLLNKEQVFLYGKNFKEIKSILEKEKINYYFFDEADNLLINFLLNDKKV